MVKGACGEWEFCGERDFCGEGIYPRSAAKQSSNHCMRFDFEVLGPLRSPTGINPLATEPSHHRPPSPQKPAPTGAGGGMEICVVVDPRHL